MPFYRDYVYPHLVDLLGDPPPIHAIRQKVIPFARGIVLEIGVGSGANFIHYDSAGVSKLYALEPNQGMIRLAKRRLRRMNLNVEFLDLPGEHIPLADNTLDTVVSTFTLCTIPGIMDAIRDIRRVLRVDGEFLFIELGLSPDPAVQHWQRRLEPICKWLYQGLYLTRDIPFLIRKGGFQIKQMKQAYIAEFPKSLTYCWCGTAIPQP